MHGTTAQVGIGPRSAGTDKGGTPSRWFITFYTAVVAVQSVHVVEHVIQLVQVYVLGVPDDEALGLLGYIYQFQGTEEWLHLVFNLVYFISLTLIAAGLLRSRAATSAVPILALAAFLVFGVSLEGWHVVEHAVIISNVVANNGCPCPGIVDAGLGVSDTILHFGYNTVAYAATAAPLWFLRPAAPASMPLRSIGSGQSS